MTLYHVTTASLLPAILREGLRPDLAQTVRQEVWLVEANRLLWAFMHVARRHGCCVGSLAAVRVAVPAARLRSRGNGLFTTAILVGPKCIRAVTSLSLKHRRVK